MSPNPVLVSWPLDTPAASAVVKAALDAQRATIGAKPLAGVPYGSDASLFTSVGGIPSVVVGPGDISVAHGPNEFVDLEELEKAADLYEAIALAFDPSDSELMEATQ
jgi:acetylornithine deacetylase/succinyl-diaminopimelate desuccinylase-like protein